MDSIHLKVKVQSIYYQSENDNLGIEHATSDKRITLLEAEEILHDREIEFVEVLKVKYEFVEIDVPLNEFTKYII